MKIKVVHSDGRVEVLDLAEGPAHIANGLSQSVLYAGRTDHFFNEDGSYDGWGMSVEGLGMSIEDAEFAVQSISNARQIDDGENEKQEPPAN